jgi:hypothetical protein
MQEGKPIAFTSRKFTPAEHNYTTFDQEMLALVHACSLWRCYLHGKPFELITDHQPLLRIPEKSDLTRRQARAVAFLGEFKYTIVYQPGKGNVADPLSRHPSLAAVTRSQTRLHATAQPSASVSAPDSRASASATAPPPPAPSLPLPPGHPTLLRDALLQAYAADPRFSEFLEYLDKGDDGLYYCNGKVFVPNNLQLRERVLREMHDQVYAGHAGVRKTLERVSRMFWWPTMRHDVYQYVVHCDICQRNKSSHQSPAGLLQPLPVPGFRWHTCTMDLIVKLPPTETTPSYDSIVVFVDKLTKMVHMAPCRESMNAQEFADLFIANVFRLHGMPEQIVSDRGTQFNNQFFAALCQRLNIKHHMGSSYHPQSNGQTERTNRTLEDMLRHYVSPMQHDWHTHLPLIEFAINSSWQESTQATPFYLMYGCHPTTPELRGIMRKPSSAAEATAVTWQQAIDDARRCLEAARNRMRSYANRFRRDVSYAPGELVLLWAGNLRVKLPGVRKLHPKYVGPLRVIHMVGAAAVRLELPPVWHRVHPVFHVSLVKKYFPDTKIVHMPPPVEVGDDGDEEYEVEAILDHRDGGKRKRKYLVAWKGYGPEHNQWLPKCALSNCKRLLRAYKTRAGLLITDSDAESDSDA